MTVTVYYDNKNQTVIEKLTRKLTVRYADQTHSLSRNEVIKLALGQSSETILIDNQKLTLEANKNHSPQIMVECMNVKELLLSATHMVTFLLSLTSLYFISDIVYQLIGPAVLQTTELLRNLAFILSGIVLISTKFKFSKLSFHKVSFIK